MIPNVTANVLYEDMELMNKMSRQITEKFVKSDDPTVVVGKYIEEVEKSMSAIKSQYRENSANRNLIVGKVLEHLRSIMEDTTDLRNILKGHQDGTRDPEDNNTTTGN